jgi:putative ABC transport system permease protein
MSFIDSLRYRLRVFTRPRAHEQAAAEEVEFHLGLDAMQREHAAHGALSTTDAHRAARRRFGNVTYYQEETRRVAGLASLDTLRQDVRFAIRSFRRTPTFTAVAVLTLAIGIGANTAIFSAVDALLLRPLPFREPERLVSLSLTIPAKSSTPARDDAGWSYLKFIAFRRGQTSFEHVTLWLGSLFTLRLADEAVRIPGEFIDAQYFATLGVVPAIGRGLREEEDYVDGPRVAVLSDWLWRAVFNADSAAVGRGFDIDGTPYTIVGVMPATFSGLSGTAAFWIPIAAGPASWPPPATVGDPYNHLFVALGRLAPGVSLDHARAEVQQLGGRVDAAYPDRGSANAHWGAAARSLDATRVDRRLRDILFILTGAVALVLLIACANVASLFLVRASGRQREIAVRLAIGAGRWRLVRQLLVESMLLSLLGGAASLLVAWVGVRALAAVQPASVLRLQSLGGLGAATIGAIRLDVTALTFTAGLAVLTGLVFGLVPALQATRPSLTESLKADGAARSNGIRGLTSRNLLTVLEIALAVVLLAGSGLMLRSLGRLLDVRPGFDPERVLTVRINRDPKWARDSLTTFIDLALARLARLPAVTEVALAECPPVEAGCGLSNYVVRVDRPPPPAGTAVPAGVHWVTPHWFSVLRVPLLRGRDFTTADRIGTRKVVLVNETAARTLWPGEDPIGRPVRWVFGLGADTADVVGVVGDVRYGTIDSLPKPAMYASFYQAPLSARMMLFLRARGDLPAVAQGARKALREVAPGFPVYDIQPMSARMAGATAYARFSAFVLALFAGLALGLAMMGTYGVISYAVVQRTREIGVRVALGATRADVVGLIVRQGLTLGGVGAVCGLAGAVLTTRVLRSLLYGVEPTDPLTLGGIAAVLVIAVLAASWFPARRAAGVPAIQALRS